MSTLGKILICDDDENLAAILEEWLGTIGFEGKFVSKPEEVIPTLTNERFDLLLLDYRMPSASGKEVLYLLRKIFNPLELPVVFLTAFGERELILDVAKLGISGFFVKPMNFEIMAEKIPLLKAKDLNIELVRALMQLCHLHDNSLVKEPGLGEIQGSRGCLYPVISGSERFVLFNSRNRPQLEQQEKWSDEEVLSGVVVFGKLNSNWYKIWPNYWSAKSLKTETDATPAEIVP